MPNASIPTPEPVKQRKMFGAYGRSVGTHSVAFVSGVNINMLIETQLKANVYLIKQKCF